MLKAAISDDQTLVAVIVPSSDRGVIQIYQTESGLLQSTLTTRKANSLQAAYNPSGTPTLESVQFCGNHHVVAKTTSSILVWDLARGGVVSQSIGDDKNILAWSCQTQVISVLVGSNNRRSGASGTGSDEDEEGDASIKLVVLQFDPTSGKVTRRIKCKKSNEGDEFGLAFTNLDGESLLLVRSNGMNVFDYDKGHRIEKIKHRDHKKKSKKDGTGGAGLVACNHLVAFPRLNSVALYNLKTKQWLDSVSASSQHPTVHMWQDGDSVQLLVDSTLYTIEDSANQVTKVQSDHAVALLPANRNQVTAVLHNASAKSSLQVQTVEYSLGEDLTLEWETPSAEQEGEPNSSNKRSAESLTVLGPGQAGGESTMVSEYRKKPRLEDDEGGEAQDTGEEGGMSIAERLKKLSEAMDDEDEDYDSDREEQRQPIVPMGYDFVHEQATTESLSQLLGQALEGGDNGLLELALAVTNRDVIEETLWGLDRKSVGILLTKLTMRMANSPTRAENLAQWLSLILKSGKLQHKDQLLPLKNLILERLDAFPVLLRLEGRLSMINTTVYTSKRTKKITIVD